MTQENLKMMQKSPPLQPRLKAIFHCLQAGHATWDICCDHGLIGIYALRYGLSPKVYFVDQVAEIMHRLSQKLADYELQDVTQVYLCSGAKIPAEKISGNVVIAGVGSLTMIEILKGIKDKLESPYFLILSPNKNPHLLEDYLESASLQIEKKQMLEEKNKARPIYYISG